MNININYFILETLYHLTYTLPYIRDGQLARGLREAAKPLDKCQAHLCILVETYTEAVYIKLIEPLPYARDGLARGLREVAKPLDKCQAHLCVLVKTCTEAEYIKLIEALCTEHKINLIKVRDAKFSAWAEDQFRGAIHGCHALWSRIMGSL